MKPTLQLKTSQHLVLTPQLQQSIKLLQLSSLDLQSELERLLAENPMLEWSEEPEEAVSGGILRATETQNVTQEAETFAESEKCEKSDFAELSDWGSGINAYDDTLDPIFNVPSTISFREHLLNQVSELILSGRDKAIVTLLIEELDEKGYLTTSLQEIVDNLPLELELDVEELEVGLNLLQQFDPAGVGARDLSESLVLQLKQLPEETLQRDLAIEIVQQHLALLGQKDFTKLKRLLRIKDEELKFAQALIASLNPYPNSGFADGETRFIIPDIWVRKHKGLWQAELNRPAIPRLRVNPVYAQAVSKQRKEVGELNNQLQEAKWLIKNLNQRFDTILRVAEVIVEEQYEFFNVGEIAMRPLILRDIAERLDLHESTISRVTSQKYLLCPRGVFELKYFFCSALDTDTGEECSATAIKARIKQLINEEPRNKPLSDNIITELLAKDGIQVARRTVAKYREAMQIPSTSQRKRL